MPEGGPMAKYHVPVMLAECLQGLNVRPGGTYVDATFGGGGHTMAILQKLGPGGRVLAFDQDADAQQNVPNDDRLTFIDQNFRYLRNYCRLHNALNADGILADLGVSSHQLDQPERGFSTRFDAGLDMRMDRSAGITAKEILNTYTEEKLHTLFGLYGEIKNARSLAKTVVTARLSQPFETTSGLKAAIAKLIPKGKENKYLAQVFQALRIEVNQEIEALRDFLKQTADVLKSGGRLVVLSYHSLEDRLVKNYIASGKFKGEVDKDFYGNPVRPFNAVSRKAITAGEKELEQNNRARSAKLRVAEKM